MQQAPNLRRRWYQFSLRELFWLALVVALFAFGIREREQGVAVEAKAANDGQLIYDLARSNEALRVELEKALRKLGM